MAKKEVIDTNWVEEIFTQNISVILHTTQEMFEKKKYVTEIKSKIYDSEKQRDNLKEYLKLLETMIRKSSQIGQLTRNLTNEIGVVQNSIVQVKQSVAILESKRKFEAKPNKEDKTMVSVMKKMLIELYDSNFDLLLNKEKRLVELKNQSKDDNTLTVFKEKKVELDKLITDYESMKAKNIRLRETLAINIERKI